MFTQRLPGLFGLLRWQVDKDCRIRPCQCRIACKAIESICEHDIQVGHKDDRNIGVTRAGGAAELDARRSRRAVADCLESGPLDAAPSFS